MKWEIPKVNDIVRYRIRTSIETSGKIGTVTSVFKDGSALVYWMCGVKKEKMSHIDIDVETIPIALLEKIEECDIEEALDELKNEIKS